MKIEYTKKFQRHFRRRVESHPELPSLFQTKVKEFIQDPFAPSLKTHKLSGRLKDCWAFSVAYDCRVVFLFEDNQETAIFVDIGTHDEVY